MSDLAIVEVVLETRDAEEIQETANVLGSLDVKEWPTARMIDPVTVLAVTGSAIELLNRLLDLRAHFAEKHAASGVTIRFASGESIKLEDVSDQVLEIHEDSIRLIAAGSQTDKPQRQQG